MPVHCNRIKIYEYMVTTLEKNMFTFDSCFKPFDIGLVVSSGLVVSQEIT